jgi:hypothetical protein
MALLGFEPAILGMYVFFFFFLVFFYLNTGGWSPYCVHSALRPLLASCTWPGWLWGWRILWNADWPEKQKYSEKTCPIANLSTTNPTWPDPGANPGRRGEKPATNRLSYGGCEVSCIRGYIILMDYVSVAWQWIFPTLGNSALQTTCHNIVAYRQLAKRWLCKQRQLLGNSSLNTFPEQWIRTQQWICCFKTGVFYVVRAEIL